MSFFATELWDNKEWSSWDWIGTTFDNKGGQNWRCGTIKHKSLTVKFVFDKQQWTTDEVWDERNWGVDRKWFPELGWVHL